MKRNVAVSLAIKPPLTPWWLVVLVAWEVFLWYMLLGIETDGMKPYIGQTGVLLIGSLLLLLAVVVIPGLMLWVIIRLVRTHLAKRQLADIDK